VLLAQGRREEASRLASEVLTRGGVLVTALMEFLPTVTPVEFAWLARDLGQEPELRTALASAPKLPWLEAARAIAEGDLVRGAELADRLGAPSAAAYARLRTAEALARLGRDAEAQKQLTPAVAFFVKAGATHYLTRAEELPGGATVLLLGTGEPSLATA
jgi:hypothetical protein